MNKVETALMLRATVALQVAALEWDGDTSATQAEARQAIIGIRESVNAIQLQLAKMQRATERVRHGR